MPGYGDLAAFISSRKDTNIYRRFAALNAENLLHMQAELNGLELTISEIRKNPDLNVFDRSWLAAPFCSSNAAMSDLFTRVRTLLDQYYRSLLQTAQINSLEAAVPKDGFQLLKHWYDEESGGNNFLDGIEAAMFRDRGCQRDLLSLNRRRGRDDPIAVFIADKVLPLYDRLIGHHVHRSKAVGAVVGARDYGERTLILIANAICMVLSAVLPALAILVLFNMKTVGARFVAIVLMSLVFSLVMTVVAQKKADIFMSTTAFAAVLVVFVGSSDAASSSSS